MKIIIASVLVAFAIALPTNMIVFDNKVLVTFGLISTQNNGGNPTALLNKLLPFLQDEPIVLDRTTQLMLLATGGINEYKAAKMLDQTLPGLVKQGKSSHEQLMALMVSSNQFCSKNGQGKCVTEEDSLVPLVTESSQRGCREHFIHTNVEITAEDKCVCEEQDNVFTWFSILDVILGYGKNKSYQDFRSNIPDQIPIILMMLMSETPCNGTLQGTYHRCQCSSVTEGNEGVLLQYLVYSPGAEDILTSSAKAKVQRMTREPGTRASDLISSLLLSQGASGSISPSFLSLMLNANSDPQQLMKQLVLSNLGLDQTMTQIILNGGFNDDGNKIAMINYFANMGLAPVNAVPFVLGVDNGIQFYINSLLSQGVIDPLMGMLLLAQQSGASQSDIFDFISQALLGGIKGDALKYYGKPYIPELPAGIYPGSKLYFAHLETLGINTCALHDLRNRFECGFTGISAAQCEVLPYCCYNPVFLTDDQAKIMTNNTITSAAAIPWCYYNVFFIYYDSFALTVKVPGQFASPANCLPLFKYGLNIDASIYYVYAQTSGSSLLSGMINARTECGFPGITEFHCVAIRGCCWDAYAPYKVPQCFNPNGNSAFDYNLNLIPVAYQPTEGTCSTNILGLDPLYYRRIPCMASFQMFVNGRDPLKLPDKVECLWKLGCCWEDNELVGKKFPHTPRCYRREDGTYISRPNNIGQLAQLIARSGGIPEKYAKATP